MKIFTNRDTGFTYIGRIEDNFEQVQFKTDEQLCYNEVFLVIDFKRMSVHRSTVLDDLKQLADNGADVEEIRQLFISPFAAYYRCSSANCCTVESINGYDLTYYEVVGDRLPCHPDLQLEERSQP